MPRFLRTSSASAPVRALDTRPDDGDARDYIFQPTLTLLPKRVNNTGRAPVLDQHNEGACVGFALATVINVSLRPKSARSGASPRMLYEMARRHDEWKGEHYEGTSLRGGMKGWHKHGVARATVWPYDPPSRGKRPDREFTEKRAIDALRLPIGAYFRIVDSDAGHMQAAIHEGDAVLASAWVHDGWESDRLTRRHGALPVIPRAARGTGLHAFAILGYGPEGFIIQNSWGRSWGNNGCAILPYDEWFEHRQDAWVARPGPTTLDAKGEPKVFIVGFAGGPEPTAQATATSGWSLDPEVAAHLINTGDRGGLSSGGSLVTRETDLPAMAQRVLLSPVLKDGCRHIVLYAHGGLNAEGVSITNASRIWESARKRQLAAYCFIWESGITESVLGWLRSDDDAAGPAQFGWSDAWEAIQKGTSKLVRKGQKALGAALAQPVRDVFWNEMKGRAQGASSDRGGATLFLRALGAIIGSTPAARFKLHLVGHSAGAVYHGWLYQLVVQPLVAGAWKGRVELGSIQLLAPAISISRARAAFGGLPSNFVQVHSLSPLDEGRDGIVIYPSSLLTYVADHLDNKKAREPLLGLRTDLANVSLPWAKHVPATMSHKHGEFDDAGKEIEAVLNRCEP